MSYRIEPEDPTPVVSDVTSETNLRILNGVISEFAIPCTYLVPTVDPVTGDEVIMTVPIRLTEEGYGNPVLAVENVPDGLTWLAWVDELDDSILRFVISAQCPDAVSEDLTTDISLLITRDTGTHGERTDAVLRGPLTIVASPVPGVAPVLPDAPVAASARVINDTSNFLVLLDGDDVTVQAALETLDSHDHPHTHVLEEHEHPEYAPMPSGVMVPFAGDAAPAGWLLCDGSAVSRVTYAALFAVIGIDHGEGDGATTFNLPNLKGRVVVGLNPGDADFATMGGTGGSKDAIVVQHSHVEQMHSTDAGVAGSQALPLTHETGGAEVTGASVADVITSGTRDVISTQNTGVSGVGKNLQPYFVSNYIIKQ